MDVSVGICAHNEEDTVGTLIDQVLDEDIPLEEIIVVAAGVDRTVEIVREMSEEHENVVLIEEDEREGQSAAQNRLLDRNSSELLFLVDGDGTIEPGSLELMLERYDGSSILYGREIPVTEGGVIGRLNDILWDIHHELSKDTPKFSTQLGLIPADVVERIPPEIVLDDEYIGVQARNAGYGIEYVPGAVKKHHTRSSFLFYLNQRRKNWAGRRQVKAEGYDNLQSTGIRTSYFLRAATRLPPTDLPFLFVLGAIEFIAIMMAAYDSFTGDYPHIWYR